MLARYRLTAGRVVAPIAVALTAVAAAVSCSGESHSRPSDTAAVGGDGAPAATGGATGTMHPGSMMVDSAMVMLHGFCLTQDMEAGPGEARRPRRIELIVGGDAVRRATHITVAAESTSAPELTAELSAGHDAHAMCVGPGATIFIGGTAMYLGSPTLRVVSGVPVTVLARTVNAETLAGPIELRPGQRGAVLEWGAARK